MRRHTYKKYVLIGLALFLAASFPIVLVEKVRTKIIAPLALIWNGVHRLETQKGMEVSRLEAENHLLRIEIGKLRALIEQQAKLDTLSDELNRFEHSSRRYDEIQYLQGLLSQAIPARVIYRDPGSFSSSLWISVGEETNQQLNRVIVQKNSPVILGRSIVGAIDYVGKKQSRVRLITDVALKPSVRAVRGYPQNMALLESINPILRHLTARTDLPISSAERASLTALLESLKTQISEDVEGWYLAKGIIQGVGTPMWRSLNHRLRGIGFNYDFADAEGPARDLDSGKPVDTDLDLPALPLIQENDLLVTTGMDGVFPPGLRVAEVIEIFPLREGAYTYEIEASPSVGNLDTLQTVFVIPPIGYNSEDQP